MKKVTSDVAYDYIRRKILGGDFPPGYALMTEALAEEIQVSRTPVRDALYKLKAEGLVSISPRLGASVKKMDLKEYREMCELRLALEGHSAALAAVNASQADLREIKYALDAMKELTAKIVASREEALLFNDLIREDVRFHIGILTAAHNNLMKREILKLNMINRVMIGPKVSKSGDKKEMDANRRKVLASHEEIYDAIARGDAAASRAAMERHLQDMVEKTIRLIAGSEMVMLRELSDEELAYGG
ncbi:MAG: GntR family transcriptional regulator [Opitutaceae bacterium]|nr:GntR family transcriptional regulator [Opitutaceae bacterium]